jgi:hypothetical protein
MHERTIVNCIKPTQNKRLAQKREHELEKGFLPLFSSPKEFIGG